MLQKHGSTFSNGQKIVQSLRLLRTRDAKYLNNKKHGLRKRRMEETVEDGTKYCKKENIDIYLERINLQGLSW